MFLVSSEMQNYFVPTGVFRQRLAGVPVLFHRQLSLSVARTYSSMLVCCDRETSVASVASVMPVLRLNRSRTLSLLGYSCIHQQSRTIPRRWWARVGEVCSVS